MRRWIFAILIFILVLGICACGREATVPAQMLSPSPTPQLTPNPIPSVTPQTSPDLSPSPSTDSTPVSTTKKDNDVLKVTIDCAKSCKWNMVNPPFTQKVISDVNQVKKFISAINQAEPIKGLPLDYGAEFLMYVTFKDGIEKIFSINISDKQSEAASLVEPMNNEQGYQGYSIPKKYADELRAIIYAHS
jgi:hypothetical protein